MSTAGYLITGLLAMISILLGAIGSIIWYFGKLYIKKTDENQKNIYNISKQMNGVTTFMKSAKEFIDHSKKDYEIVHESLEHLRKLFKSLWDRCHANHPECGKVEPIDIGTQDENT